MPSKFFRNGKWTGQWHGQIKVRGKRYRSPLLTSKAAAREWEAVVRESLKRTGKPPEAIPTVCLLDLCNGYLDAMQLRQPKTYSEKKNIMKRLVQHFGPDIPVPDILPGRALQYLNGQKAAGFSPAKARKNLAAAWTWGARYIPGFPKDNPFMAVEPFPVKRRPRYVPPMADVEKVLAIASQQDLTMLVVFLNTGARRGEVYRLTWDDIDLDRATIRFWCRKNPQGQLDPEEVPMNADLKTALAEHKVKAPSTEWVFVQPSGRYAGRPYTENRGFPQDLCEKAGVRPFGLHGLRHLVASVLAQDGVPMIDIMCILRHKKLGTTERYVHGPENVRPALRLLEGRFSHVGTKNGANTPKNERARSCNF